MITLDVMILLNYIRLVNKKKINIFFYKIIAKILSMEANLFLSKWNSF